MNFPDALFSMYDGKSVTRKGWNGKHRISIHYPTGSEPSTAAYFIIKTEKGEVRPWLATHADLLAEDWEDMN